MSGVNAGQLAKLAEYPFVVVSWIDDAGYPISVAADFQTDTIRGSVALRAPQGEAVAIPTDRQLSVLGSHIRPKPGEGYDERRYLQLWGRAVAGGDAQHLTFTPNRAWGWDETERCPSSSTRSAQFRSRAATWHSSPPRRGG